MSSAMYDSIERASPARFDPRTFASEGGGRTVAVVVVLDVVDSELAAESPLPSSRIVVTGRAVDDVDVDECTVGSNVIARRETATMTIPMRVDRIPCRTRLTRSTVTTHRRRSNGFRANTARNHDRAVADDSTSRTATSSAVRRCSASVFPRLGDASGRPACCWASRSRSAVHALARTPQSDDRRCDAVRGQREVVVSVFIAR